MDGRQTVLTAGFRPKQSYTQVPITANAPSLPTKLDVGSADPMYADIYNEYNSTLDNLNTRLQNANQQAQTGQQAVQKGYDIATTNAENAYTGNLDSIRSTNQDAQLRNRLAARAGGAGASSGFMDLTNRTDLQSQKDIAQAGRQLTGGYQEADLTAQKALAAIQASLGDIVAQIQGDATMSLRQKNDAINQAKVRASQLAAQTDWSSIFGQQQQSEPYTDPLNGLEVEVPGAPNQENQKNNVLGKGWGGVLSGFKGTSRAGGAGGGSSAF